MNGTRILDFSRVLAGPWATQMLADQGADVIKIEPPDGDETRAFAPLVQGVSTYFLSANRNKRSLRLDLRTEAGREVALGLARRADVVVENFRPGVMGRLGLSWETLSAQNPRLVYVAIHAFGEDGPPEWVSRPGYDLVLQAMGGAVSFTGYPGSPPIRAGAPVADLLAGLQAVQAVLLGLLDRERTGVGQKIVVNMMQVQLGALVYHATRQAITGESEVQRGNAHRGLVPYDVYPCQDGWIALACGNDGIWRRLVAALALPVEPAWSTNGGRVASRDRVDRVVRDALAVYTAEQADELLARAGVPAGRVLDVQQVRAHPAVHEVEVEHPVLGRVSLPAPSVTTRTTRSEHASPPVLGGDQESVLAEIGWTADQVAAAARAGAFGTGQRPDGD